MRTPRVGFLVLVPSVIMALAAPAMSASWQRLDSGIAPINTWAPAVTAWVFPNGVEYVDVYAVTSDSLHNLVDTTVFVNNGGGPFSFGTLNLGGNLIYAPAALRVPNLDFTSHQEVFGIGTDHALYHRTSDNGGTWSGWASLGKPSAGLCSAPSAASWNQRSDRMDVFVIGCDNRLWQKTFDGTWRNWVSPADAVSPSGSAPVAAVARGPVQVLDVFVVNSASGHVVDIRYDGSWHSTDIPATSADGSVTAVPLEYYPTAFTKVRFIGLAALENKHGFPGQFWPPASLGASPMGSPIALENPHFEPENAEVYYLDGSSQVRRGLYAPGGDSAGQWLASSQNLTGVTFSGGLNGYAPTTISGVVVFAAKNDGTTWFALDTDS